MKVLAALAVLAALCAPLAPASAQSIVAAPSEASRKLGECIVLSTTGRDRILVARWMGSAIASAPQLDSLVTVDAEAKEQVDVEMAALFTRLFTEDCSAEARPLLTSQDNAGMEAAGGMLGEMAMRELMSDPQANQALMNCLRHVDPSAFMALWQPAPE